MPAVITPFGLKSHGRGLSGEGGVIVTPCFQVIVHRSVAIFRAVSPSASAIELRFLEELVCYSLGSSDLCNVTVQSRFGDSHHPTDFVDGVLALVIEFHR